MVRKCLAKETRKRKLANLKEKSDLNTGLCKKKYKKVGHKQPAANTNTKRGQWEEKCLNSIMTKSRFHLGGEKDTSGKKPFKTKRKRNKKAFWASFVSHLDTLSIPIVTRNMSRQFDSWKQCLPRSNEGRLTQLQDGNNFPLWNYRSGIITRALSKRVDIGQTNPLFAKLPASVAQMQTPLMNESSKDIRKEGHLKKNLPTVFKKEPVRDVIRPVVTRTRKLHLRNKVLSYIYQDANVWWGCGDANNQIGAPNAVEIKPKGTGSDVGMLRGEPNVQMARTNEPYQILVDSGRSRQVTHDKQLNSLDTLSRHVPSHIVARNMSSIFGAWQQHVPRDSQNLQNQLTGSPLWYHQSGIFSRTLTKRPDIGQNQSIANLSTMTRPNHLVDESLNDVKEKTISQQMNNHRTVRVGIGQKNDLSMITRSRKLQLRNKVVSYIYQDANNWWGRGDSITANRLPHVLESKKGISSHENMVPGETACVQQI